IDASALADLASGAATNSVDVGQCVSELLATGEINSSNSSHNEPLSALALLVPRVTAQNANHATALHDLALVTDFLDAGPDLHRGTLLELLDDMTPSGVVGGDLNQD